MLLLYLISRVCWIEAWGSLSVVCLFLAIECDFPRVFVNIDAIFSFVFFHCFIVQLCSLLKCN
ncbi:MAG: hypothetical protein J3R72DRAFT_443100 [Linnemannia gamsii]|nr:MAG: hypothetical protein J3R72DRAFT_443100 [Linnemannia gamsii]